MSLLGAAFSNAASRWHGARRKKAKSSAAQPASRGARASYVRAVPHARRLEVGSWSWNWMEPPLGTISFFLLCMQFAREQRVNIGIKPFTERLKLHQADKVHTAAATARAPF